jgi:hypothetical protein
MMRFLQLTAIGSNDGSLLISLQLLGWLIRPMLRPNHHACAYSRATLRHWTTAALELCEAQPRPVAPF